MNWNEIKNNVTFNDIKEMEYKSQPCERFDKPARYEILCQSWYKGYKVLIVSYFTHPCAYIGLPEDHPYYNVDYDDIPIDCHGGLTYGSNNHNVVTELRDNGYFIGWDYAHYGDYMSPLDSASPFFNNKKWTTREIIDECFNVIDQLEKIKQKALEE